MSNKVKDSCRMVTGKVRLNYVRLSEKQVAESKEDGRYSLCMLIHKKDHHTIDKIKHAMYAAFEKGLSKDLWQKDDYSNIKKPLRDGDIEQANKEGYEEQFFLNASSRYKPQVIDGLKQKLHENILYSGCYSKVSITFFPYIYEGTKGIGCLLNSIQFIDDGTPLSNVINAEDEFDIEWDEQGDIF